MSVHYNADDLREENVGVDRLRVDARADWPWCWRRSEGAQIEASKEDSDCWLGEGAWPVS